MGSMTLKARVHHILEGMDHDDKMATAVTVLIASLIVISVFSVILESVQYLSERYGDLFLGSEIIIVGIFTVEYILRIWSCTEDSRYAHPVKGRLRYALSLFALLDLLAILPFYLPLLITFDARFLRALRLVRFLRITKLARYSHSVGLLTRVVKRQKETLLVTFLFITILIVFASCLMWQVEHEVQPDKFSSIPDTMWWAVATVTTVGYGDVVPITPLGKFLGAFIAIMGVGLIAMPAGIIVTGFIDEAKDKEERCKPHPVEKFEKRLELLERLGHLRESGVVTDEEYLHLKTDLLGEYASEPGLPR